MFSRTEFFKAAASGLVSGVVGYFTREVLASTGILKPFAITAGAWITMNVSVNLALNAIGLFVFIVLYAFLWIRGGPSRWTDIAVSGWLTPQEARARFGADNMYSELISGALIARGARLLQGDHAVLIQADEWRYLHLDFENGVAYRKMRYGGAQYIGIVIGKPLSSLSMIAKIAGRLKTAMFIVLFLVLAACLSVGGAFIIGP